MVEGLNHQKEDILEHKSIGNVAGFNFEFYLAYNILTLIIM
jgi:hypothetical protein